MDLSFTVVSSFTLGLFCGVVVKSNWHRIKYTLSPKSAPLTRSAQKYSKKNDDCKDDSEWEDIDSDSDSKNVFYSNHVKE